MKVQIFTSLTKDNYLKCFWDSVGARLKFRKARNKPLHLLKPRQARFFMQRFTFYLAQCFIVEIYQYLPETKKIVVCLLPKFDR